MTRRDAALGWAVLTVLGCSDPDPAGGQDGTGTDATSHGGTSTPGASDSATDAAGLTTPEGTSTTDDGLDDSGSGPGTDGTGEPMLDPLPLLAEGSHVSMIVGFEVPAPGTEALVDARWNEALDAGIDLGRIQLDWAELEPAAGEYDLGELTEQLEALAADGLQAMLTLSTIDSLAYTVPADLSDPDDPLALAGGMRMDDPVVLDRFAALLDVVVPLVADHGGFLISVGNEPDNAFEAAPEFAEEVAGFTAAAKTHAATVDPRVAISITLTYASIDTYAESAVVLDVVDVVALNLYCQSDSGAVQDASVVASKVAAIIDVVGDKPVVFQELGCPAGWENMPTTIDGSPDKQAAFFAAMSDAMVRHPQLRAAYVFQMLDWSDELVALFSAELQAAGFGQAVIDLFAESLGTMGLCRYSDGTCRPAWDVVLQAIGVHAG